MSDKILKAFTSTLNNPDVPPEFKLMVVAMALEQVQLKLKELSDKLKVTTENLDVGKITVPEAVESLNEVIAEIGY